MNRIAPLLILASLAAGAHAAPLSDRIRAGCPVHVEKAVDGDVLAAGCEVRIDAKVDGTLRAAGGDVQVAPDAVITGDASLAGGEVVVKGTIQGNLRAGGGEVTIDGNVEGDADVGAGELRLGPNAKIGGKLRYRAGDFHRDPEAQVAKGVSRRAHRQVSWDGDGFRPHRSSSVAGWIWTATLMIFAGAIAALLPGFSGRVAGELRTRPWHTLLFGFIAFVCIPAAAVLLMLTVIGIPIGILAILGYALLLLVGYVVTSIVVGGLLLDRIKPEAAASVGWRALAAVGTMLAIAIVGRVPVLGHLVIFVALLVGVGAIVAAVIHSRKQASPPPLPAA